MKEANHLTNFFFFFGQRAQLIMIREACQFSQYPAARHITPQHVPLIPLAQKKGVTQQSISYDICKLRSTWIVYDDKKGFFFFFGSVWMRRRRLFSSYRDIWNEAACYFSMTTVMKLGQITIISPFFTDVRLMQTCAGSNMLLKCGSGSRWLLILVCFMWNWVF